MKCNRLKCYPELCPSLNATSPDKVMMSFLRSSSLKTVLPVSTQLQIFLRRVALYPTSQTTHNRNIYQHPFLSTHMEMLQEESECRAVSRNKVSEAAASALYCFLLIPFEAGMECAAN